MAEQWDMELGRNRAVEFLDVDTRASFITKTYMHLAGAMALFVGLEVALMQSPIIEKLASLPFIAIFGAFMVGGWIASHVAHRVQSLPLQYVALVAFVGLEAVLFAPLLYFLEHYKTGGMGILTNAAVTTLIAFAGLTAIAFITRKDFSFLRGTLYFVGVCAMIAIVGSFIFGFSLGLWFTVGMIVFAGAAILYDTSNVIHHYPEDRYVAAALELFSSVALMFWYVLRLFMSSGD